MSDKFQKALAGVTKQVTFWTPDGSRTYTYRLLKQKEAARIYYTTIATLIKAIAQAATGDALSKMRAVEALDFDTAWDLGRSLLSGCLIRTDPENEDDFIKVDNYETCTYFDDAQEERLIAIYQGIIANFPKSQERFQRAISGFGLKVEQLMEMAKKLGIPLPQDLSAPATSPSSTEYPQSK